jgi:hypothetical protein
VVAAAINLGEVAVERVIAEGPDADDWLSVTCRSHVPLARLEREAGSINVDGNQKPTWVSLAELFTLGLTVAKEPNRDEAHAEELASSIADLQAALNVVGPGWRDVLDCVGAPTPYINGTGRPWVGRWAAYEAIEYEGPVELIHERELVDLRFRIIRYLGDHGLPGEIGFDLMVQAVVAAGGGLSIETLYDWQGFLRWLKTLDDGFFDEVMRQCFSDGLYSAQL